MSSAMAAEFDTVADWTADVAIDLGPEHYIAAGCRGSGNPGTLEWFLEALHLSARDRMLDCGAGVGGPGAFAHERIGVRPVLAEPEAGACRSAKRLFELPVVRADATRLPFADGHFDAAWCLGVLCTMTDQLGLLRELRRVLTPTGRLGLLVFLAQTDELPEQPDGNNFPTEAALQHMISGTGFVIERQTTIAATSAEPAGWSRRVEAVEDELDRRHHDDPAWQTAQAQSAIMGRLITTGALVPRCLSLTAAAG